MEELPSQDLTSGFPIVGIVASAGGLDAFKKFFSAMPADSGMAFVLIPHLDPSHDSLMVELLSKVTSMPVVEAGQDLIVEVNRVYIIPPKYFLAISNGRLQLSEPLKERSWQTSIDFFLRSLAQDQKERAIGIVLSGTGSHGVLGVREIKLAGGMTMAQQPDTAEYDQMPTNAIATGQVDSVMPPEQMPEVLVKYFEQPYLSSAGKVATPSAESADLLNQVLTLLQSQTKYDFRSYRKAMVLRRIQRRMGLAHVDSITCYLDMLQQRPEEVTALYKDLLISVTAYFRDPDAYRVLEQELIPALIARHTGETPIRVWVPGCATGEEAYSIAMLLLEGIKAASLTRNIQIFASDIDQDAIDVARVGTYPASILSDVSPERRKRFFRAVDDSHYQIDKQLRESIVFSQQNLISDAPFSRLDFISCRNLLIYLEPEMQQKVMALFHFALVPDGNLLLGPSETMGNSTDLFEPVSKKWRVYRRIGPSRRDLIGIPLTKTDERGSVTQQPIPVLHRKGLKELAEKLVLNEFAPAAALINRKYEVLYVTGPLVNYLEFPLGELTKDLLAMARAGLRTKLRFACNNAIRDGKTIVETGARVKRNGHYVNCSFTVRPLSDAKESEGLMLVVFQDRSPQDQGTGQSLDENKGQALQGEDSPLVQQLELELKSMSEELHSTIEEMESSTEELKTSNEEITSVNEELQSANEELETSKEELQSLNEELSTVNSQLQEKVAELDKATDDLINLMSSTEIATIFLDEQLNIKRFTPPTKSLLSLRFTDVGRPLREIASKFHDDQMLIECQQVLESLIPIEREVQADESRYYLRRILPYRSTDNDIRGVVITFVDLTQRKQAEAVQRDADARSVAALHESNERMGAILNTAADAIFTFDQQGKIDSINRATETLFGYARDELIGQNVSMLIPSIYDNQRDSAVTGADAADGQNRQVQFIARAQESVAQHKDGAPFPVDFVFSKVDHLGLYTGILRDISERKELQSHILEIASEEQRRIGQELHDGTQQELTGLTLFAGALCELLDTGARRETSDGEGWMLNEKDLGKLKQTADRLLQGLKAANQHVRTLSHGIMPVQVDAEGLRSALAELAAFTNEQQQIHCHFEFSGSSSVSDNSIARQLYRIAQESLNNALQHGLANDILISLSQQDGQIVLEVCDNGVGIDPHLKQDLGKVGGGMGLRIMEYRVSMLGGVLQVDRNSGPGTTVRCTIPTKGVLT